MKTSLAAAAVAVFSFLAVGPLCAGGIDKMTDLTEALSKAQSEGKMLFVQYGREACGNCQALKSYIKGRSLRLSESKFVYADVNCDDAKTSQLFRQKFKVAGSTLPFVVVASPDGTQLAARAGYGTVKDYENLLRDAAKATKQKE